MINYAREERGQGVPLTDAERRERHYELYGNSLLPPRGTGLRNQISGPRITGVEIPTPVFAGGLGFLIGMILGPALIASTDAGSRWLRKTAESKFAARA